MLVAFYSGISSGQMLWHILRLSQHQVLQFRVKLLLSEGETAEVVTKGRHDPCVGIIRAVPIAEAMLAITLMDHLLRHRGQNADVVTDTPKI